MLEIFFFYINISNLLDYQSKQGLVKNEFLKVRE